MVNDYGKENLEYITEEVLEKILLTHPHIWYETLNKSNTFE